MHPQQTLWRRTAAAFALAFLVAGNCSAQGLVVWFDNGRVTVLAEQVSVRQILMEWSRIGSVSLENADRLPSAPIVVHLVNLPERAALETLLRGVNGYILGSRPSARTTDTAIDRIWITVPGRPAPSTLLANAASTNTVASNTAVSNTVAPAAAVVPAQQVLRPAIQMPIFDNPDSTGEPADDEARGGRRTSGRFGAATGGSTAPTRTPRAPASQPAGSSASGGRAGVVDPVEVPPQPPVISKSPSEMSAAELSSAGGDSGN